MPSVYRQKDSTWLVLLILWTLFIFYLHWQQYQNSLQTVYRLAEKEASASYNKDLVYRRWGSLQGGVYVEISPYTPPNPYLAHIPDRDVTTTEGKQLTLVNPAYMMRQVHELSSEQYGVKGHITSLRPLRPENKPDPWERKQLNAFEAGAGPGSGLAEIDGAEYLRMIFPMRTEQSCLKCHAEQGYRLGELRGGISVSVPMAPYRKMHAENVQGLALTAMIEWLLGVCGLLVARNKVRSQFLALLQNEKKFTAVFDRAPIMLTLSRIEDGIYLDANDKFLETSGFRREEVLGKSAIELGWISEQTHRQLVEGLQRDGFVAGQEIPIINKAGEQLRCSYYGELLELDGKPRLLSLALDITEHRQLEERLLQAEKLQAIGQLAGGIAHDFNNQLSGVLGYTDMLLRKSDDPKTLAYAGSIKRSAQRAAELTRQLLTFARKEKLHTQPVRLHETIGEVISILSHSIDKRIEIHQQLQATNDTTIGDPTLLQNALLNIALNARDAMPQGGVLGFATSQVELNAAFCSQRAEKLKPGYFLQIDISDTGTGIPPEQLDKVFDPFFTTKATGKGTGMGLASAYGTLCSHQGLIDVTSHPGRGTRFSLYLPLAAAQQQPQEADTEPISGEGLILLVDDEPAARQAAAEMLRELGYRVAECADGPAALEYFRAHRDRVDLVLLDMIMPKLDGRDTFKALREIDPAVKVVLTTGYSVDEQLQDLLTAGVRQLLPKPYELSRLSQVLSDELGTA